MTRGTSGAPSWRDQIVGAVDAATRAIPGTDLFTEADPASFGPALARFGRRLALAPVDTAAAVTRYVAGVSSAAVVGVLRAIGQPVTGPVASPPSDRRFADPTWEANAWYYTLRQRYLLLERLVADLVRVADLDPATRAKTEFALRQLLDAAAPTNTLPGNPAALKRAFETGGLSVARGARTFLSDLTTHGGRPRQAVPGRFAVGRDLAATPGKVVFRNDVMELIQYAPQTDQVHQVPLLLSPPWINKYYLLDLAPERSLVEWAVQHGLTVFCISYRNPDAAMRGVRLDDYLVSGPRAAIDVVTEVTGAEQISVLGLCLGGTLTMATLAHLASTGDQRVRSATLLNTLVDFSDPGPIGVFTDAGTVERLERRMARTGFLAGTDMRATFDLLRSNDLIWAYVVNNWLLGEDPKPFDILAWNDDSTRMPADMHAFYLRSCYRDNELARGSMELDGVRIDLGAVSEDLYVVAAEADHIAPWRSVYRGALLPKGDVRFVLSNSGHIAGVVNPPHPKARHWVLDGRDGPVDLPADPDAWRSRATERRASWWEDWTGWITERSGDLGSPPPMGGPSARIVGEAPGTYVHER